MIRSREDLKLANRVVIKAGTSVVSTPEGYPSLSRMANIVEHAAKLVRDKKEVVIVTSGAIGVGRQKLARQADGQRSLNDVIFNRDNKPFSTKNYNAACAAAGQLGLMSLYETMFSQFNITVSQVLVTSLDFNTPERRRMVKKTLSDLLSVGIVPLLNENDAVSGNEGYKTFDEAFSDNDSLASLVAIEISAPLLILLTDVKGVYDRPPTEPEAQIIDVFQQQTEFVEGSKSLQGRGGMGAKVDAALKAVNGGVQAVVIGAGHDPETIGRAIAGEKVGTLFLHNVSSMSSPYASSANLPTLIGNPVEDLTALAEQCRISSRILASSSGEIRKQILLRISSKLIENAEKILEVNREEIIEAEKTGMSNAMVARLRLSPSKIQSLANGIAQIAEMNDPINEPLGKWLVAEDLVLEKVSCPIGVILVIFESRPDCLPQIASLAIKSGNGLILKGGKEALQTNHLLYSLITEAIDEASNESIPSTIINLVNTREDIQQLLKLDEYIDLVIPRGSNELVKSIMANTKIQVLGHADGVCHIYVDEYADEVKAQRIIIDAKLDYPAACNAVETILFHRKHASSGLMERMLRLLRKEGVMIYGGNKAKEEGLVEQIVTNYHTEYSDLKVTVEIVEDQNEAMNHINSFSSHHTECIITEDEKHAKEFFQSIDSACVFHNSSTRFADGYRFGLGAEVGISTSRIHARGPVGVEGLLSYKWHLKSSSKEGHIVAANKSASIGDSKAITYLHEKLSL